VTDQENRQTRASLRVRMLLSASLVLVVFLGIMGLVLDNAYRLSAEQTVSERLLLHIYALIAASVEDDDLDANSLYLPDVLQEPDFNAMGSGLYGVVFNQEAEEIWRSQSAFDLSLGEAARATLLEQQIAGAVTFDRLGEVEEREPVFFLTYPVIWQSSGGEARYTYVVMQNFIPYSNAVSAFRNNLWGWLIAGVVVLVGLQAAIMYWGLLPIAGLEHDLNAIEEGKQDYLVGQYPKEIAGVTRSLNMLLNQERSQRERYRTTLADLAHSLKNPLAILKTAADKPNPDAAEIAGTMDTQVTRMSEIVSYQLERAVVSSSALVKTSTSIEAPIGKLVEALRQVYQEKALQIKAEIGPGIFPGDERDLLELLGNLLDNACKYGSSRAVLLAQTSQDQLVFVIEDDGPGIDVADRERVLQRGMRLDTQESGHGIGLAVVAEIVSRHQGAIALGDSSLGGAKIEVRFPTQA
jgi:two-component system sensor histidine kinase PhoQ